VLPKFSYTTTDATNCIGYLFRLRLIWSTFRIKKESTLLCLSNRNHSRTLAQFQVLRRI
jgi:hypothetical protein